MLADLAEEPVDVRVGLGVHADRPGVGGEHVDQVAGAFDHEMDVEEAARPAHEGRQLLGEPRPERQVRDEPSVHDVDVEDPGTGVEQRFDLIAEVEEVRGHEGRQHRPAGKGVHDT